MKLLIAYDGSECSRAALEELRRIGLPLRDVDAMILGVDPTMANAVLPHANNAVFVEANLATSPNALRVEGEPVLEANAVRKVDEAFERLSQHFPLWTIEKRALCGPPCFLITQEIKNMKPDLVVVGSHNKNLLQRLFFGSMSKYLADHTSCSIHVTKPSLFSSNGPPRLMIALDDSQMSKLAVEEVASRHWPVGTEVLLLSVVDRFLYEPELLTADAYSQSAFEVQKLKLKACLENAKEMLKDTALQVTTLCRVGSPISVIEDEAARNHIDVLFIGAAKHNIVERALCGSISSGLVAKSNCSVEIVRPRTGALTGTRGHRTSRFHNEVQFN
jgi:nucleotide-binding universal stress UspA family protein